MFRSCLIASLVLATAAPAMAQEATGEPISRQQFISEMDQQFTQLDADGDGMVSAEEIAASDRAAAQAEALRQNRAVFDGLDTNGDGALSPEEFATLANPDAVPVQGPQILASFDTDKDGSISQLEYRIATQANFDRIDADRDGVVTPTEMQAAGLPSN